MPQRNSSNRIESRIAHATRPLLALARHVTGLETTLVRVHVDQKPDAQPEGAGGLRIFWAGPSLVDGTACTSLCGASQSHSTLSAEQAATMQLVADCLQRACETEREACLAREREELAEKEAIEARNEAKRHATDRLHMERLAHTDELTGLLNRRAFIERWLDESARSAAREYPIALIVIDADKFKRVNDTFGHLQGDVVLRAIGATLLEVGRPTDIVARLGGDEFALVTTHASMDALVAMADEIKARFAVLAAELGVDTTLSIGIVSSDDCAREDMVAQADAALYRSKAADGNDAGACAPRGSSFAEQSDPVFRQRRALR